MFAYLSKKITAPESSDVYCLAWSKEYGYIACGCKNGYLKVLRFDPVKQDDSSSSSNLNMNKSLDGHKSSVIHAVWNEKFEKLTTADKSGLVIVWAYHKNSQNWYQEMVNSQNKSHVNSLKWDSQGRRICIVYQDGSIIVGTVEGNRLWGKDLSLGSIQSSAWSPDGTIILFGLSNGEIIIVDQFGNIKSKMSVCCLDKKSSNSKPVSIEWSDSKDSFFATTPPCLAIAFQNGRFQISRSIKDKDLISVESGIEISKACWNNQGSILAVAGLQKDLETKDIIVIQLYSPYGDHLRTLTVPGKQITSCCFDGRGSLRLALSVDSFIYLSSIRPLYQYGYMHKNSTLVFLSNTLIPMPTHSNVEVSHRVIFWNLRDKTARTVKIMNITLIACGYEFCCFAKRSSSPDQPCQLRVYNSLGILVDERSLKFIPVCIDMTDKHIVACGNKEIFSWILLDAKTLGYFRQPKLNHNLEKYISLNEIESNSSNEFKAPIVNVNICKNSLKYSSKYVFLSLESGTILKLNIHDFSLIEKQNCISSKPCKLASNCIGDLVAIIDEYGHLSVHCFTKDEGEVSNIPETKIQNNFPRKDAWDMKFALDSPYQFASMEKTRLLLFDNLEPEEPIPSSTYFINFNDLTVRSVNLDNIYENEGKISQSDFVDYYIKAFRQCKNLAISTNLEELQLHAETLTHPKIWKYLAETSLEQGNLDLAEFSFVHLQSLPGIRFVQKLRQIQSQDIVKASVKAYLGKFDEAEKIYLDDDRADLALELRSYEGNWIRVAQLVKDARINITDTEMARIQFAIGQGHLNSFDWSESSQFFARASAGGDVAATNKLIDCLYHSEEWGILEKLPEKLPDNHASLSLLYERCKSVGMFQSACIALVKSDKIKEAIELVIKSHHWELTPYLISKVENQESQLLKNNLNNLLKTSADNLVKEGKWTCAVQLFIKIGRYFDAANLAFMKAEELRKEKRTETSALCLKMLYVLTALLVENATKPSGLIGQGKAGIFINEDKSSKPESTLNSLLTLGSKYKEDHDSNASHMSCLPKKIQDQPWSFAEAYHWLILTQNFCNNGEYEKAMTIVKFLSSYKDIINPVEIYSLQALIYQKLQLCREYSRAISALKRNSQNKLDNKSKTEGLDSLIINDLLPPFCDEDFDTNFLNSNFDLLIKYSEKDFRNEIQIKQNTKLLCCVTGEIIKDQSDAYMCTHCGHYTKKSEILKFEICPLCHQIPIHK